MSYSDYSSFGDQRGHYPARKLLPNPHALEAPLTPIYTDSNTPFAGIRPEPLPISSAEYSEQALVLAYVSGDIEVDELEARLNIVWGLQW